MAGRLIVISGSSGAGKSTLIRRALDMPGVEVRVSVSATTRPPRAGEVDGIHYHFLDRDQFEAAITRGEFLEWAEYAGNLYGTPASAVRALVEQGETVLLEIEVQGALQVRERFPEALLVWIDVADPDVLAARLKSRASDTEVAIARRLEQARWEKTQADRYDRWILNDEVDRAAAELAGLLAKTTTGA